MLPHPRNNKFPQEEGRVLPHLGSKKLPHPEGRTALQKESRMLFHLELRKARHSKGTETACRQKQRP